MLTTIVLILFLLYLIVIGSFALGFDKVKEFPLEDLTAVNRFSVVIPFRNEVKNLPLLLKSITSLNYPPAFFELIFVDDDSTDHSTEIIHAALQDTPMTYRIITNHRQSPSPKKDAITAAIKTAKNAWIITTDADCQLPKFWLDCFDEFIQKQAPKVIVAPVTLHKTTTFFKRFQCLDVLSLQASTMGGFGINKPFMANGANLGYHTSVFSKIGGFSDNNHMASGDDVFLLQKALTAFPKEVRYLKQLKATVTTTPERTFKHFFYQRVRWAAKSSHYKSAFAKLTGLIVLLVNGGLISIGILALAGYFNEHTLFKLFCLKFLIDFLLMFKAARFFKQETALRAYILSSVLYPFLTLLVVSTSIFGSYKWKGRTFKK